MSKELDYSVFSDAQTLKNVRKILSTGNVSHIRSVDSEILNEAESIRGISDTLGRDYLLSTLDSIKNYIPVTDALFFLVESYKRGVIEEAKLVLEEASRDEKFLTRTELMDILDNHDEVPMDWAISTLAAPGKDRYASNNFNKSSLDMSRLNGFL